MLRRTVVAAAAIGALLLAANITHLTTVVRMSSLSPRLDVLDVAVQQLGRDLELLPAPPPPPPPPVSTPPPPPPPPPQPAAVLEQRVHARALRLEQRLAKRLALPSAPLSESWSSKVGLRDNFLLAQHIPVHSDAQARQLLKSMFGLAKLLNRTLVVPAALCESLCSGTSCAAGSWGCTLKPVARAALAHWRPSASSTAILLAPESSTMLPALAAAHLFQGEGALAALPAHIRRSHVRVSIPDGLSDSEATFALREYRASTRLLELERAALAFCGWDPRHDAQRLGVAFEADVIAVLGDEPTPLAQCSHFHAGAAVVLSFTNLGTAGDVTNVSAPFSSLPATVRRLPNGTDLLVTFATGSVSTMAINWAANVRRAGVADLLIGALDAEMMEACAQHDVPCVLIHGGETSRMLAAAPGQNLRSRPKLYPKMSVLKVGFYNELLRYGFNVWACDADAIFIADPRPLMRLPAWQDAMLAAATDCIDIRVDSRFPMLNCDLNTGLVYMRSHPTTIAFTARWRETIASAKEIRVRDQAAFNMLLKARRLRYLRGRLFAGANGESDITLGLLPLSQFLNGHTFFVQHAHTLPNAAPPLSVHLTYQFAEGSTFAHGKRQRMRQAGLWLVDDDTYFTGRYITAASESANLMPIQTLGPHVPSSEAIARHLAEARHRSDVLRALLGIAKASGRTLILPRMLCYCDYMWKEMKSCRVGGAESMRLPFDCPMDHVLDTPRWFEKNELLDKVGLREPSFLNNPRVPLNVSGSSISVKLGKALTDVQVRAALAPHEGVAVVRIEEPIGAFCGFVDRAENVRFEKASQRLLEYKRSPFCYEDGVTVPAYSQCCTPRKPGDAFFPCIHGFDPPEPLPSCEGVFR